MRSNQTDQQFSLGEFEELIILAILWLQDDAYGVRIRQLIERETARPTSIGAVYTTLERLQAKGYVTSRQGEATPERGGRAKRYFRVEGAGAEALHQAMNSRKRLLAGISSEVLPCPI